MADVHTLFVYGSLMRGRSNYPRYMGRSSFLGNAYITGFILYDLGYFPAIKHGEDGGRVLGELYQVGQEDFEAICHLEGNGELYQYEAVTAYPEGGGEAVQAETFVLIPDLTGMGVPRVPEEAQPWRKDSDGQYVWYACYGSNMIPSFHLHPPKSGKRNRP